ncbi:hypothetical protein P1P75_10880 [Streptomyces sp. ID05-39B]|nr:hypothetical protein [Streptomyces sp. ID05-39B]MDX3526932.1 hypothetical protein [Streptomyces sp. ID05-39B]
MQHGKEMWRTIRLAISSTGMTVRLCVILLVIGAIPWLLSRG